MTSHKHRLLLGAHVSTAGGFEKAIERGEALGCTTIQIFTKSNRQWHAKKITDEEADLFIKAQKQSSIDPVIAHCSYLINIGSPKKDIEKKSVAALIEEVQRCDKLKIRGLVLHPGAHLGSDEQECLKRIAENLDTVFEKTETKTTILLETMAGQGSTIGNSFEQLATIYNHSAHKRKIEFCLDTCHVFAAGYDLRTEKTYDALWKKFNDILGIDKLGAIHVNDSKKSLGCHVDRHEDIGKGELGLEAFRLIFNDPRLFDIPKIIETPKDDPEEDARNLATIRHLIAPTTRKKLGIN